MKVAGDRGFALHASDRAVEAHLTVEWRQHPQREAAIRAFFESREIAATEDYLAGNGGVPDATRLLAYPLAGSPPGVATATKGLYSDPSVSMYRPEAVVAELGDGAQVPALCFNLRIAPPSGESNDAYARKLRDLARRLGLPADYVDQIG